MSTPSPPCACCSLAVKYLLEIKHGLSKVVQAVEEEEDFSQEELSTDVDEDEKEEPVFKKNRVAPPKKRPPTH